MFETDEKKDISQNKLKKTYITEFEDLTISNKADGISKKVKELANALLKASKDDYSKLLAIMNSGNVHVIVSKPLIFPLEFLGYDEGFIPAHKSLKAFILSLFIKLFTKKDIKISFSLPDLFICSENKLEFYFLAHQFYHFLSYKNHLPGYDYQSLSLFRMLMHTKNTNNISFRNLGINKMLAMKNTIERDKEAIEFVQDFARENIGAKNCIDEILSGKPVNI